MAVQSPRTIWKDCLFCNVYFCCLCQKLGDYSYMGLYLDLLLYSITLCLFVCRYHAVFVTMALQYNLKSAVGILISFLFIQSSFEILSYMWETKAMFYPLNRKEFLGRIQTKEVEFFLQIARKGKSNQGKVIYWRVGIFFKKQAFHFYNRADLSMPIKA